MNTVSLVTCLLILLLINLRVGCVRGNSNGAPSSACGSGSASLNPAPGHGGSWQTSTSPVSLSATVGGVATTSYTSGTPVTITMTSTTGFSFKGFMFSVFKQSDTTGLTRLGSFAAVTGLAKQQCSGQAATQTSATSRTTVSVVWTPPAASGSGTVSVRASMVQSMSTYWLVPQLLLTEVVAGGGGTTGSATGGTSAAASSTGSAAPPPPPPTVGTPPPNPVSMYGISSLVSLGSGSTMLTMRIIPPYYQNVVHVYYIELANVTTSKIKWEFATNITVPTTPLTSYDTPIGPLMPNTSYVFRVRSYSNAGTGFGLTSTAPNVTYHTSLISDPTPVTSQPNVLSVPDATNPSLKVDISGMVPLITDPQVLSYEIQYKSSNDTSWTNMMVLSPLTSTSLTIPGLQTGSYDVEARINTMRGTSSWSTTNSAMIQAYSPCPNSCSGTGTCITPDNVCYCDDGWLGADCSVPSRIGWGGGPQGEQCFQGQSFCIDFGMANEGRNDSTMYFKLTIPTLGWAGILMDAPDGMTGGTGYYFVRNPAIAATSTIPAQPSSTVATTIYSPDLTAPVALSDSEQDALVLSSVTSMVTPDGQGTIFFFAKQMFVAPATLLPKGKQDYAWAFGRTNDIVLHLNSDRGRLKIDWYLGTVEEVGPPNILRVYSSMIAATLAVLIIGGLLAHNVFVQYSPLGHAWLQRRVGRWKGDCGWYGTLTLSIISTIQDFLWGEVAMIALYLLCLTIMVMVGQAEWQKANKDATFVWGHVAAMHYAFVMLPVAKNNIWAWWFSSSFERLIKWHRICGRLAVAYTYIHMIEMIKLRGSGVISATTANTMGLYSTIFFTIVMLSGWEPVRRKFWKFFIFVHLTCAPLGYIFACMHIKYAVWFSIPPAILFALDIILRLVVRPLIMHRRTHAELQMMDYTGANQAVAAAVALAAQQGIKLKVHGSGAGRVTKIILDVKGFPRNIEPGSYCFLNIPSVNLFQWHPFSINNFPPAPPYAAAPTRLEFLVLDVGQNWTHKLYNMVQNGRGAPGDMMVMIDGPYGRMQVDVQRFRTLVLVAGGIGVTPMLSMLDYLIQQLEGGDPALVGLHSVHLLWTSRSPDCFTAWAGELFEKLRKSRYASMFKLHLHCTAYKSHQGPKNVDPKLTGTPAIYGPGSEVPMMQMTSERLRTIPPPPPIPPKIPAPLSNSKAAASSTGRPIPPPMGSRRLQPLRGSTSASVVPAPQSPPAPPSPPQPPTAVVVDIPSLTNPSTSVTHPPPPPPPAYPNRQQFSLGSPRTPSIPVVSPSTTGVSEPNDPPTPVRVNSFGQAGPMEVASPSPHLSRIGQSDVQDMVSIRREGSSPVNSEDFIRVNNHRMNVGSIFNSFSLELMSVNLNALPENHIARITQNCSRSVAVMVCGPESLVSAAQQGARERGFYFHKETFAF